MRIFIYEYLCGGARAARPGAASLRARRLAGLGGPPPPPLPYPPPAPPFAFPLVCKPRHGAGSQATFLVRDARELGQVLARVRAEGWPGEMVLQPHVPGRPVSVAL